jgi:hypothetical protein
MMTIKTNHLEESNSMKTKPMTQIKVAFYGIARGKRKTLHHLLNIADIDGNGMLSPDDFNEYERKAWRMLEEKGYRLSPNNSESNHVTAQICAYDAQYDEVSDIIMVKMLPKQQQTIMKRL